MCVRVPGFATSQNEDKPFNTRLRFLSRYLTGQFHQFIYLLFNMLVVKNIEKMEHGTSSISELRFKETKNACNRGSKTLQFCVAPGHHELEIRKARAG